MLAGGLAVAVHLVDGVRGVVEPDNMRLVGCTDQEEDGVVDDVAALTGELDRDPGIQCAVEFEWFSRRSSQGTRRSCTRAAASNSV